LIWRVLVIIFSLLLALISGCNATTTPESGQEKPHGMTLGTWWWNVQLLRSADACNSRLDFLKKEGVTEIYLYFGGVVSTKYYQEFIVDCYRRNIRVAALGGDADWLSDEGYARYKRWLARIARYQAESSESEKFYGVHLDFEPGQDPDYAADPSSKSDSVARIYNSGRGFCDENNLIFEADVSMWIDDKRLLMSDQDQQVTLGEYITRRVDTVSIMAYRDSAIAQYQGASPMIRLSSKYGKKVLIGSETGISDEADFVTYFEEGKAHFNQEQLKLKSLMDKENIEYGLAVHHVESWLELKN